MGQERRAHRAAWVDANGPISEGMCVLHRCDNPPCVNVDHLFLGTQADNIADMVAKGRYISYWAVNPPTKCPRGHPYTAENTNRYKDGKRRCRTCNRERLQHYREGRRAALAKKPTDDE